MRFSFWTTLAQPWADVLAVARHAEATGWDGLYVADHFMGSGGEWGPDTTPNLEATATLAGLAAATERMRLGSLVLGNTYRHPAVVANWAATVDHISDGRLVLGIGAGWQENEHGQYGIELPRPGERVQRLDEACQVLKSLLRLERSSFGGAHYRLADAVAEPKPVQQPLPLLIGGKGDRMLGVVARHADEWNMWGLAPAIAERTEVLERRCEALGRDPATVQRSAQALVVLTNDGSKARELLGRLSARPTIAGTTDAVLDAVAAWQDVGVNEVIVPDFALGGGAARRDRMDEVIEAVTRAFGTR